MAATADGEGMWLFRSAAVMFDCVKAIIKRRKMRKKIITAIIFLAIALSATVFSASSCKDQPHEHEYTQEIIPPTCIDGGYTIFTCSCGDRYGEVTEPLGHDLVFVSDNNATCEHDGTKTEVCMRENCGYTGITVDDENSRLPHMYDQEVEWTYCLKTPATCMNVAEYYKSCKCGVFDENESGTFFGTELGEHVFDQKIVEEKYLFLEANCRYSASYFYSCVCGEKGEDTFAYGEPRGHIFTKYRYNHDADCLSYGTKTAVCDAENCRETDTVPAPEYGYGEHVYDKEVVLDKYIKTPATCIRSAEYYRSCKCGAFDENDSENVFWYGDFSDDHVFGEVAEIDYIKSSADCFNRAVYYKSCTVCGKKGEETFEWGEKREHSFDRYAAEPQYFAFEATCTQPAYYYKSCYYCHTSSNDPEIVFSSGNAKGHLFTMYVYDNNATCYADGTETATCDREGCSATKTRTKYGTYGHIFTKYISDNNGTCTEDGTETATCDREGCSQKDVRVLPDSKTPHVYDREVENAELLASAAQCKQKARYYYSCKCGACDKSVADTFECGNFEHEFENGVCKKCSIWQPTDNISYWLPTDGECATAFIDYALEKTVIAEMYMGKPVKKVCTKYLSSNKVMSTLYFPYSVEEIEDDSFIGCSGLETVIFNEGLKKIGKNSFVGCTSLKKISIPYSLKEIGENAFRESEDNYNAKCLLEEIDIKNVSAWCRISNERQGSTHWGATITIDGEKIVNLVIPGDVEVVSGGTFGNCLDIETVVIEEGVTRVEDRAFYAGEKLRAITLPSTLKSIGTVASGSSELSIYINDVASYCRSWAGSAFGNTPDRKLYLNGVLVKDLVIPEGVEYVAYEFDFMKHIESVVMPESLTTIYGNAFEYCTSLKKVVVGNNVTYMGAYAFRGCDNIKYNVYGDADYLGNAENPHVICVRGKIDKNSYKIAPGTKLIADNAFYGKREFYTVVIPESVVAIGNGAFGGTDISSIYISDLKKWCEIDFSDYVGNSSRDVAYFLNGEKITDLVIPDGTRYISARAFAEADIKSLIVPSSVKSIGEFAFVGCRNLETVTIADGVDEIQRGALWCDVDGLKWSGILKKVSIGGIVREFAADTFGDLYDVLEQKAEFLTSYEGGLYVGNDANPYMILVKKTGDGAVHENTVVVAAKAIWKGTFVLPQSVRVIGSNNYLMGVTLPDRIDYIGLDCHFNVIDHNSMFLYGVNTDNLPYVLLGTEFYTAKVTEPVDCEVDASVRIINHYVFSYVFRNKVDMNYDSVDLILSLLIHKNVTFIGRNVAFNGYFPIYYEGNEQRWNEINSERYENADVYFYSEEKPTSSGKFWHYGADGKPTPWYK
ncbi:MAG: leucine-rich repeat domain-containing protein [Firmicutes bacterium]|nr:leucine-rich repeat domain-containing protein [Bacillota bacterium]MDY5531552.1 leucine-rich repeat domain-containing protein [Pumilibacteraceae bacterium]